MGGGLGDETGCNQRCGDKHYARNEIQERDDDATAEFNEKNFRRNLRDEIKYENN